MRNSPAPLQEIIYLTFKETDNVVNYTQLTPMNQNLHCCPSSVIKKHHNAWQQGNHLSLWISVNRFMEIKGFDQMKLIWKILKVIPDLKLISYP